MMSNFYNFAASAGGVEDSVVLAGDEVFKDIVELANGCVCCTIKYRPTTRSIHELVFKNELSCLDLFLDFRSDFVSGLEVLVKKKSFDYIFLVRDSTL